jgi:hypothetical protein
MDMSNLELNLIDTQNDFERRTLEIQRRRHRKEEVDNIALGLLESLPGGRQMAKRIVPSDTEEDPYTGRWSTTEEEDDGFDTKLSML